MLPSVAAVAGVWAARRALSMLSRESVRGCVAVVTGGAGGLGLLLCEELVRRGARAVAVLDLEQGAADSAAERLLLVASEARETTSARGYACNVGDAAAVKAVASKVEAELGPVDLLVNNAGIVSGKPFLQLSEEQIRRTFAVNTLAHFWTLRAFLPGMVKRDKGVVVTISSAGGMVGTNGLADYSASKFAVYGMDESLRLDLRKMGSKVHTLCVTPFYINTGLFDGVKTKVPLLLPLLEPRPVATAIVDAIEARQHYLEIPSTLGLTWVTKMLPTRLRDSLLDLLGVTSSMDDFRGRTNGGKIPSKL